MLRLQSGARRVVAMCLKDLEETSKIGRGAVIPHMKDRRIYVMKFFSGAPTVVRSYVINGSTTNRQLDQTFPLMQPFLIANISLSAEKR